MSKLCRIELLSPGHEAVEHGPHLLRPVGEVGDALEPAQQHRVEVEGDGRVQFFGEAAHVGLLARDHDQGLEVDGVPRDPGEPRAPPADSARPPGLGLWLAVRKWLLGVCVSAEHLAQFLSLVVKVVLVNGLVSFALRPFVLVFLLLFEVLERREVAQTEVAEHFGSPEVYWCSLI